jgi:hypothetical protein
MAHLYALHLDLQENIVGSRGVERGRHIWWTVYALNQKLTSNSGLPNFLNDSDIKSPPPNPSPSDEDGIALVLHVKICQLLGLSINSKVICMSNHGPSIDFIQEFMAPRRTIESLLSHPLG